MSLEITNRAKITSRIIAVLVTAFGLYLIIFWVVLPLLKNYEWESAFDILFMFVYPIPVFAFGCYCILAAYKLWAKFSVESAKRVSFIISFVLFFMVLIQIRPFIKETRWDMLGIPIIMIPAGIFYIFLNKFSKKIFGLQAETDWKEREKSSKRFFGWLAFFSWGAIQNLLFYLLPEIQYKISGVISVLVSILLAFLIYKIGVAVALRSKARDISEGNSLPDTKTD